MNIEEIRGDIRRCINNTDQFMVALDSLAGNVGTKDFNKIIDELCSYLVTDDMTEILAFRGIATALSGKNNYLWENKEYESFYKENKEDIFNRLSLILEIFEVAMSKEDEDYFKKSLNEGRGINWKVLSYYIPEEYQLKVIYLLAAFITTYPLPKRQIDGIEWLENGEVIYLNLDRIPKYGELSMLKMDNIHFDVNENIEINTHYLIGNSHSKYSTTSEPLSPFLYGMRKCEIGDLLSLFLRKDVQEDIQIVLNEAYLKYNDETNLIEDYRRLFRELYRYNIFTQGVYGINTLINIDAEYKYNGGNEVLRDALESLVDFIEVICKNKPYRDDNVAEGDAIELLRKYINLLMLKASTVYNKNR